jgi:hypothetical protein
MIIPLVAGGGSGGCGEQGFGEGPQALGVVRVEGVTGHADAGGRAGHHGARPVKSMPAATSAAVLANPKGVWIKLI